MIFSSMSCAAGCSQDQFFAPHRLHFGKPQIFGHCANLKVCETSPTTLPSQILY